MRDHSDMKGSALILVVLVIAGVITAVFGTQKLVLVQSYQSTAEEDNLYAYYAARAGIEDGLARFRFSRDVETLPNRVQRFNVTLGRLVYTQDQINGEIPDTTPISAVEYSPGRQYYDLKIDFKEPSIGDFDFPQDSPTLNKDDFLELGGFTPTNGANYFLRYAFNFLNGCNNGKVSIESITEVEGSSTKTLDNQVIEQQLGFSIYDSADRGSNFQIRTGTNLVTTLRIRPYNCNIQYAFATTESVSSSLPNGVEFDSLMTRITSTGYYGRAKRTLIAEVDRKSGQLLSIYDFTLYGGRHVRPQ